MFLHELKSDDSRFKHLEFHEGMNLLLAERASESGSGESRNGAGKTSFVLILRYLLGGNLGKSLKDAKELADCAFECVIDDGRGGACHVSRRVSGFESVSVDSAEFAKDEWRKTVGKRYFGLDGVSPRPTSSQLVSQLARVYFDNATKVDSHESDCESGIRIGYLLGLSQEVLVKSREVVDLEKRKAALDKAASTGALEHLALNEPAIRADLVSARSARDKLQRNLKAYRVDKAYEDHQREADYLTGEIQALNDEALALERRLSDIKSAEAEDSAISADKARDMVASMYEEAGIAMPELVMRRYDEVEQFHASVIRNRRHFLKEEAASISARLDAIERERNALDAQRAAKMELLKDSMALETYDSMQREVTSLDAMIADLEAKLKDAGALNEISVDLKLKTASAESSIRAELEERSDDINEAIALFGQLGEEIYSDRKVSLLVDVTQRGRFRVEPKIEGDASSGITSVKTFLVDLVCMVQAIKNNRAPRMLVHDSKLFDAMDDRQLGSCLNIGARLAEEHGFQYIVALNTDRLEAAEREGFDRAGYPLKATLSDSGEDGGLFGLRFG